LPIYIYRTIKHKQLSDDIIFTLLPNIGLS